VYLSVFFTLFPAAAVHIAAGVYHFAPTVLLALTPVPLGVRVRVRVRAGVGLGLGFVVKVS